MFENETFENLLKRKLDTVPDIYDKREGSVIYNALAPNALEIQQLYMTLGWLYDQLNPQTADFEHLKRWAAPFGIVPQEAEPCVIKGNFDQAIPNGTRFNWKDINFVMVDASQNQLVAELAGAISIRQGDLLTPIDAINELTISEVAEVLIPGKNAETLEEFRERVAVDQGRQAYGGNIADYERMVNMIPGVGAVLVKRAPDGPGTVGLVIVDNDFNAPTQELIDRVQNAIDPPGYKGDGLGLAPIDHLVKVTGAQNDEIDVGLHLTYAPGYDWETIQKSVREVLEAYLEEVRRLWKDGRLIVFISQIESRLLKLEAITDIGHTTINGVEENYAVQAESVPIIRSVTAG